MDKAKQLAAILRDTAQSTSNAIAGNISGPVDLLAMGMRGIGLPVPQNAFGGSQWMEEKGLTKEVPMGAPRIIGETLGMAGPMLASAKAPQIASGLLQGADNLAVPRTLNNQAGMINTQFGRIPENGNEIDSMHKMLSDQLERAGNVVQSGSSNLSASRYLTVKRNGLPDLQVRLSNHGDRHAGQMLGGEFGERFSVDPNSGNTFEMAKQFLKDSGVNFKPKPKTVTPKYTYEQLEIMTGGQTKSEVERLSKIMGWL